MSLSKSSLKLSIGRTVYGYWGISSFSSKLLTVSSTQFRHITSLSEFRNCSYFCLDNKEDRTGFVSVESNDSTYYTIEMELWYNLKYNKCKSNLIERRFKINDDSMTLNYISLQSTIIAFDLLTLSIILH